MSNRSRNGKVFLSGWTGMRRCPMAGFYGQAWIHMSANLVRRSKGHWTPMLFGGLWLHSTIVSVDCASPPIVLTYVARMTVLKNYCSLIHGQPVIESTLDLRRSYQARWPQTGSQHVRCDIFRPANILRRRGVESTLRIIPGLKNKATQTSNTSFLRLGGCC